LQQFYTTFNYAVTQPSTDTTLGIHPRMNGASNAVQKKGRNVFAEFILQKIA
jgi:hypothetical protein